MMSSNRILLFALLYVLLTGGTALAHKVNLFAYVDGGTIYTESYFPDGRKVQQGTVEIRDSQDRLLVTGHTDEEGLYHCPIPKIDDLTIDIKASMGHRNSFRLKKSELEAGK